MNITYMDHYYIVGFEFISNHYSIFRMLLTTDIDKRRLLYLQRIENF